MRTKQDRSSQSMRSTESGQLRTRGGSRNGRYPSTPQENREYIKKQTLSQMTRKQRKVWNKMSKKEQEKLLKTVERKTDRKMKRRNAVRQIASSGGQLKKNIRQAENYRKNQKKGSVPMKTAGTTMRIQKKSPRILKASIRQGSSTVNMKKAAAIRKVNKKREAAKLKPREAVKQKSRQAERREQKRTGKDQKKQKREGKRKSDRGEYKKEYKKQLKKQTKKAAIKQSKAFQKEFVNQLKNEILKAGQMDQAQKAAQREMTFEQYGKKQMSSSVHMAFLPVSIPLKMKARQLMAQIASAIGGFIASVVTAVLPLIAILAVVVGIISFITGIFGILAGSWDGATAGLPDASYVANTAVQWAEYIAENDDHGYNDGFFSRWGPTDYSNITFVVTAFDRTGLSLKKDGAKQVSDLYDACMLNGFLDVKSEVSSTKDLKKGDLLVKLGSGRNARLAIYCGDKKMVNAVCDENGGQKHGTPGDQTGREICIESYAKKGWDHILRYYGDMTLYGGVGQELVDFALKYVGKLPYVYGGSSLVSGADCSGFVQAVYSHFGYSIPRTAGAQYAGGRKIGRNPDKWQPGDLIYYSTTGSVQYGGGVGEHVVIYIGNGKVVEESNETTGCIVSNWNYRNDCMGAVRYLPDFDNSDLLIGNDNSTKIWNYLRRTLGCSRAAAAGVMGSIYAESGFDPGAVQPNGVGHGICQWSWSRWYGSDGLQNFASSHHRNWSDLALQLAFFKHEAVENNSMSAYYPGGFQKYKAITSVDGEGGSAQVFFYSFEYGNYVSYSTFLSAEFEMNFACTSKRLKVARSCYNNISTYP